METPLQIVTKALFLFADAERSPTLLICPLPALWFVSSTRHCQPCSAPCTASWTAPPPTSCTRSSWWMTTVNWVRGSFRNIALLDPPVLYWLVKMNRGSHDAKPVCTAAHPPECWPVQAGVWCPEMPKAISSLPLVPLYWWALYHTGFNIQNQVLKLIIIESKNVRGLEGTLKII